MNTDRLIDILSANAEPVKRGQLGTALILAILAGGAASFGLMLATVGPRPELQSSAHLEWVTVKVFFALSVICTGAPLLIRSMRPGMEGETHLALLFVPFVVAIAAALAMLFGESQIWITMLRGATTISPVRCLLSIVIFAALPLAAVIFVLRSKGAPTRLRLCGGIAGIVAGGIGATVYAFNCTSDTIPFIAIWYGAAIVLCAVIGAQFGPRVLRW